MEQKLKPIDWAEKLQGISYADWVKVRAVIDRSFELQKKELERGLQLTDFEQLDRVTRSLFG